MANTVIALKKSAVPSAAPSAGNLANGEIAINYADGILYYKNVAGYVASISGGTGPGGNYFGTVDANGTLLIADTSGDVLSIYPGDNIIISGDAINDKMYINVNLSAANSWANTKLANATGTLAGSLTTTGTIRANSYVYISPEGGDEGGEIQLFAAGNYTNWSIDAYQNNYRVFARTGSTVSNVNFFHATGGSIRLGINKTDPAYAVDVTGDVNITGSYRVNGVPLATGTVDLTPANNWANTKVASVTSNSTSRIWANTAIDGNNNENVYLDLALSGVTASVYGGASQVPVITIDGYGRVTSASNVASSGGGGAPTMVIVTGTTQIGVKDNRYVLTNTSPTTVTLPASPSAGDTLYTVIANGLANNVVARNGNKIMSLDEDLTLDINYLSIGLMYVNATLGWVII